MYLPRDPTLGVDLLRKLIGVRRPGYTTVKARYKTVKARYKTVKARYKTVKARYKTVKARYKTVIYLPRDATLGGDLFRKLLGRARLRTASVCMGERESVCV